MSRGKWAPLSARQRKELSGVQTLTSLDGAVVTVDLHDGKGPQKMKMVEVKPKMGKRRRRRA